MRHGYGRIHPGSYQAIHLPTTGLSVLSGMVVLDSRPKTVSEAVEAARSLTQATESGHLHTGRQRIGWSVRGSIGEASGGHPSGVVRSDLAVSAGLLAGGTLRLPRHLDLPIPITRLGNLGSWGPVDRDINEVGGGAQPRGPFDVAPLPERSAHRQASWPILWAHEARFEREMIVEPDSEGHPRRGQRDKAVRMWGGYVNRNGTHIAGATRLHINRDFQMTSQALGACLTPNPVIGGRAWPSFGVMPTDAEDRILWEKALALWMNSTVRPDRPMVRIEPTTARPCQSDHHDYREHTRRGLPGTEPGPTRTIGYQV